MHLEFKIYPVPIKTTQITPTGPLLPEKPGSENRNYSGDRVLSSLEIGCLIEELQSWLHASLGISYCLCSRDKVGEKVNLLLTSPPLSTSPVPEHGKAGLTASPHL